MSGECPRCNGVGRSAAGATVIGGEVVEVDVDCPDCDGTGKRTTTALIAALQLGPGSRELDVLVYLRVHPHVQRGTGPQGSYFIVDDATQKMFPCPYLTTSVDDALAHVPEGWGFTITTAMSGRFYGSVFPPDGPLVRFDCIATAPALAICIAVIKAKEAESD